MRRHALGLALILILAACGDDAGGGTTTTGGGSTTAPSTTAAGSTTTVAATTAATTTLAADAHPVFGLSWAAVWPGDGATATYQVTRFDGSTADLPARMEYGVEYRGRTLDRLVVGTAEPSNEGWAVYFDRSEPWVLVVIASEIYYPEIASGPGFTESFEEPVRFDGNLDVGETYEVESTITLEFEGGASESMGVTYRMTPATIEDSVTVPFGTIDGVMRLEAAVGGELIGGTFFDVVLWLHPDLALVRFEGAPAWDIIELVEPWA